MCSWLGLNFGKTKRGIVRWLAHNSSTPICSKFSLTYQDRLFCTNQKSLPTIAAHLTLLDKRFPVRMNTFLYSSFANRVTKLVSRTTRYIKIFTLISKALCVNPAFLYLCNRLVLGTSFTSQYLRSFQRCCN